MSDIITTHGETFSHALSVDLARLVYRRFGRDSPVAAAAWRRLLGNGCPEAEFNKLVFYPEHTPNCDDERLCGQRASAIHLARSQTP